MKSTPSPERPHLGPERIGHRGAPREFRENTIPAFARALELGADAVELDVHCTSDGVVVVHHDPSITTSGDSLIEIATTPWSALRNVEVAPGITIPTLDAVLDLVGHSAAVYVEIKGKSIEHAVVATVGRHPARAAIHSFDHGAIAVVRTLSATMPTGILVEDAALDPIAALSVSQSRDLWPHYSLIDATLVRRVHHAGCRVIAWTVNTPAEVSRLVRLGVDGICTDNLALLR